MRREIDDIGPENIMHGLRDKMPSRTCGYTAFYNKAGKVVADMPTGSVGAGGFKDGGQRVGYWINDKTDNEQDPHASIQINMRDPKTENSSDPLEWLRDDPRQPWWKRQTYTLPLGEFDESAVEIRFGLKGITLKVTKD